MSNNLADDAGNMRREEGEKSVKMFARLYMSAHFKIPPSKAHEEIYGLLDQCIKRRGSKVVIAAPRGLGKSTVITLAYIVYCVCYKKEPYIMVLSHGKSQACQILENVRCVPRSTSSTQRGELLPVTAVNFFHLPRPTSSTS